MKTILLSFDIEEFACPAEGGVEISHEEQMDYAIRGTRAILDVLKKYPDVKATFFCTGVFAENAIDIIKEMQDGGHEIASHTYSHHKFVESDLAKSKKILEEITGTEIVGFRMAQLREVSKKGIKEAGYRYNSSLNPTFLPGRYNHITAKRLWAVEDGVVQLPVGVTPIVRFPLFWISCHVLPFWLYMLLLKWTLIFDPYVVLYFHPWEFVQLKKKEHNLSFFVAHNSGELMVKRLDILVANLSKNNRFATIKDYLRL